MLWVDADRTHRSLLQRFCCTSADPPAAGGRPAPHPRPWEREVQSHIRQLKPPIKDQILALGYASDELAAVAHFDLDEPDSASPSAFIYAIAVANSQRGRQGDAANQAVEHVLQRTAAHFAAVGGSRALVVANINEANEASRHLLLRHGFARVGQTVGHEQFALNVTF